MAFSQNKILANRSHKILNNNNKKGRYSLIAMTLPTASATSSNYNSGMEPTKTPNKLHSSLVIPSSTAATSFLLYSRMTQSNDASPNYVSPVSLSSTTSTSTSEISHEQVLDKALDIVLDRKQAKNVDDLPLCSKVCLLEDDYLERERKRELLLDNMHRLNEMVRLYCNNELELDLDSDLDSDLEED